MRGHTWYLNLQRVWNLRMAFSLCTASEWWNSDISISETASGTFTAHRRNMAAVGSKYSMKHLFFPTIWKHYYFTDVLESWEVEAHIKLISRLDNKRRISSGKYHEEKTRWQCIYYKCRLNRQGSQNQRKISVAFCRWGSKLPRSQCWVKLLW